MKLSYWIFLPLLIALASTAQAQDPKANENLKLATGEPERCVAINRIDEIEVIDDRNVLFYMVGKQQVYLNDLPRSCPGFRRDRTVMYRTSLNELCNVDILTALDQVGGGFMPGPSCGLGLFYPIDKDEADRLKKESRR